MPYPTTYRLANSRTRCNLCCCPISTYHIYIAKEVALVNGGVQLLLCAWSFDACTKTNYLVVEHKPTLLSFHAIVVHAVSHSAVATIRGSAYKVGNTCYTPIIVVFNFTCRKCGARNLIPFPYWEDVDIFITHYADAGGTFAEVCTPKVFTITTL